MSDDEFRGEISHDSSDDSGADADDEADEQPPAPSKIWLRWPLDPGQTGRCWHCKWPTRDPDPAKFISEHMKNGRCVVFVSDMTVGAKNALQSVLTNSTSCSREGKQWLHSRRHSLRNEEQRYFKYSKLDGALAARPGFFTLPRRLRWSSCVLGCIATSESSVSSGPPRTTPYMPIQLRALVVAPS